MDQFTLAGETGRISLSFEYAQCGADGCDCRGTASIASWGFRAQGKVWFTAADVARFHRELDACYQALDGVARFSSSEENLRLEVVFGHRGRVDIRGTFQETHNEGNEVPHSDRPELYLPVAGATGRAGQTLRRGRVRAGME